MISIPTNLEEFDLMYPTNESCRRALWNAAGETCSHCGCSELIELKGRTSRQCKNCRKHISVTAGTAFHGCHHLRACFLLAFCVFHGMCISAAELASRTQIAGSTAFLLVHKLQLVLLSELDQTSSTAVDSDFFGTVLFRRSRISPAHQHPSAHSELERSRSNGDAAESVSDAPAGPVAIVADAVAAIQTTFHGISRKYLQLYLALYWSSLQNWSFESLIRRCLASSAIKRRVIEEYVSPRFVSICGRPAVNVI